jgi:hypothetical protein
MPGMLQYLCKIVAQSKQITNFAQMRAKTLTPYEVKLTKGIITIRVATIMAVDKDEAVEKGLLLLMAENDLESATKWAATAEKIK